MIATAVKNCIEQVKRHGLLIGAMGVLMSCQSNQPSNKKNTLKRPEHKISLKTQFLPVIQGVWVKKDYIDRIARTRSPAASAELAEGITVLYFDKEKMSGDSLIADAIWNNHEGSNAIVHFKPGKRSRTLLLFEDISGFSVSSLGYKITGRDTVLIKYHTGQDKTTVINYVKAFDRQPHDQMDAGMNYLINDRLIAGSYILMNAKGTKSRVIFTKEGKVNGLEQFSNYYIKNDVDGEALNNLDEIIFDMSVKNKRKDFAFKITGDTITLYNTYPNDNFTKSILGKAIYKLIKQQ